MDSAPEQFYRKDSPGPTADIRDAMSRRGDFEPNPSEYANESNFFEVLAVLEALSIEGEVLT